MDSKVKRKHLSLKLQGVNRRGGGYERSKTFLKRLTKLPADMLIISQERFRKREIFI